MRFKDFIYYLMLIVVAGLFLVLAFSYFEGKDNQSVNVDGLDRVSVDLASGLVNTETNFETDLPDIETYDVLEFYLYSPNGSGFGQIVVSDYINIMDSNYIYGSLIVLGVDSSILFFTFYYDLENDFLKCFLVGVNLMFEPVDADGYFYLKGVNYVS